MRRYLFSACLAAVAAFLLLAPRCEAQLQFGSNLVLRGTGSLTAGYHGSFGDEVQSNHGLGLGGSGDVSGYYFDPKFISFKAQPYYQQSRSNSSYQSIYDSSGVNITSQIFAGSMFPGAIGFSESLNNFSYFGQTGGPEVATTGRGRGYNISWSELLPGVPPLTATFTRSTGSSNVIGTGGKNNSQSNALNLRSNYSLRDYRLTVTYFRSSQDAETPGFLLGQEQFDSKAKSDSLAFQVTHRLPLHGSFYADASRSHYEDFYQGVSDGKTTTDAVSSGFNLTLTKKLNVSVNGAYSDNLSGTLRQELSLDGITPLVNFGSGTHSYSLSSGASYSILRNLNASATITHMEQFYGQRNYAATYFSGTLFGNYQKPLFGMLNWSISALDNANQEGNSGLGISTSVSLNRRVHAWEFAAGVDYQQDVQTILVAYTTSSFRWNATAARKFHRHWHWNAGVGGGHSGFSAQAGDGNHSESIFSGVGNGRISLSSNYTQSTGTSVLTSSGLQSSPVPIGVLTNQSLILYDAKSFSVGATANPKRGLTITADYSKANSSTTSTSANSLNQSDLLSTQIQYAVRRLGISAGFTRFSQSVGVAGAATAKVNSYYFGVNRWFNFF